MNQAVNVLTGNFPFEGVIIEKLMIHRVFAPAEDKTRVPPAVKKHFINLNAEEKSALQSRVTAALGNRSHGIEMSIDQADEGSFFQIAAEMLHCDVGRFIELSEVLANNLTDALTRKIPGGVMAIISGRVGEHARPFVSVIKAEFQDGFTTEAVDDQTVALNYVRDIFLTEAQKLYKIGCLVENVSAPPENGMYNKSNYRAFLFDHLLTSVETRTAASYFYNAFLGMGISSSSKKLTQNFYEYTVDYINSLDVDEGKKFDYVESLRAELKSQTAIVSSADFAEKYLEEDHSEAYVDYMQDRGFPQGGVEKDVEYIESKLRKKRKVNFTSGVSITGPSDDFQNLVTVEERGDNDTLVRIQGNVSDLG